MDNQEKNNRIFKSLLIGLLILLSPILYGIHWKKRNDIQIELYKAINRQDLPKVKQLIKLGADLNKSNGLLFPDFNRGINLNALGSYISEFIATLKIHKEASVKCENTLLTARWIEINNNKAMNLVAFLKALGAKENWHSASAAGDISFLKKEFGRTGKLVETTCTYGSPLSLAAMHGKNEVIKFFVKNGSNPNRPDEFTGLKPMYFAIDFGHTKTVELLLSLKTKIENNHVSMFTLSVMKGYPDLIPIIVKHGPPVSANDVGAAFNLAVRFHAKTFIGLTNPDRGTYIKVIHILKKEGFDPNNILANGQQGTPLHGAVHYGEEAAIKALLEVGSNPNAKDSMGNTPVSELCKGSSTGKKTEIERINLLRLLVDAGGKVNVLNITKESPLDHARKNRWKKLEKTLISYGAKSGSDLRRTLLPAQ